MNQAAPLAPVEAAVVIALAAAVLSAPAGLLPAPWPAVVGLLATGMGLSLVRRRVGGGRAGAVGGGLVGVAVGAPSALPLVAELSFQPFLQPAGTPALEAVLASERLCASLAAGNWATLLSVCGVPALCALFGGLGTARPAVARLPCPDAVPASRMSLVVPILFFIYLVPMTIAEVYALGELINNASKVGLGQPGPQAAVSSVAVYLLVRLATWIIALGSVVRGLRSTLPVSLARTVGVGGLLLAAASLPNIALGLVAALGAVDAIPSLYHGGEIAPDWSLLYRWGVAATLIVTASFCAQLLVLLGAGRLLRRSVAGGSPSVARSRYCPPRPANT